MGSGTGLHSSTPETAPSTTLRNVGLSLSRAYSPSCFAVWRGWVGRNARQNAAQLQAENCVCAKQKTAQQSFAQRTLPARGGDARQCRPFGAVGWHIFAEASRRGTPRNSIISRQWSLFCAFVRNPTVSESDPPKLEMIDEPRSRPILREDLQVILTALGSRREASIDLEKATKEFRLELHHADLVLQRRFLNLVSFLTGKSLSRKARPQSCRARGAGCYEGYSRSLSCDPSVVITRSLAGKAIGRVFALRQTDVL